MSTSEHSSSAQSCTPSWRVRRALSGEGALGLAASSLRRPAASSPASRARVESFVILNKTLSRMVYSHYPDASGGFGARGQRAPPSSISQRSSFPLLCGSFETSLITVPPPRRTVVLPGAPAAGANQAIWFGPRRGHKSGLARACARADMSGTLSSPACQDWGRPAYLEGRANYAVRNN